MKQYMLIILAVIILAISGCSSADDFEWEYSDYRIEVLYEHTYLMQNYANESLLTQIGLDMSYFPNDSSLLSAEKKKEILVKAYNSNSTDIADLEDQMVAMMDKWVEIEYAE